LTDWRGRVGVSSVQERLEANSRVQVESETRPTAFECADVRTTGTIPELAARVQGEYREMPGLSLTAVQAQRLWCLDPDTCATVLSWLVDRDFLRRTEFGKYVRTRC
jgi:hypothetical protein